MLYIEYNFYWWLTAVGPTSAANVGPMDVGPMSVRWGNAIWVQAEVQKHLHTFDKVSRLDVKGRSTDVYKCGRFMAGIHKVGQVIPWAQDYCTTVTGYKQPTYHEINVFQWSQGFVYCVLEESDGKTRENMLRYYTSLMEDAVKMLFATEKEHIVLF